MLLIVNTETQKTRCLMMRDKSAVIFLCYAVLSVTFDMYIATYLNIELLDLVLHVLVI